MVCKQLSKFVVEHGLAYICRREQARTTTTVCEHTLSESMAEILTFWIPTDGFDAAIICCVDIPRQAL